MSYYAFRLILFVNLVLNGNAEIEILAQGIDSLGNDDIAIVFYVTVKNICKDDLELSINMLQCCESVNPDEVDCTSMTLIGGDMGILPSMYVKNLTLIYPNIYLLNRRGVCSVNVIYCNQLKKREISTDIHFDSIKACPGKHRQSYCETIDLNFNQNCNPVDCLMKYSGAISYFNPECKRCQKVPICNSKTERCFPDVAYSPYNNECGDLNIPISKRDLERIENTDNTQVSMVNAICHYGKVSENGECFCHDGWVSMYEPGVAQHHLCNVQIGDWNCVNRSRIRITAILIAIFAVTVVSKVLLLMCVMTWCYKHFRQSGKACVKDLNPESTSIVLCEELEAFEKCLCCETDENHENPRKSKTLHSQTVNVSYFPCSPSVFSSMRTSTDSTKYSIKSGPSRDLSNTSSSAVISFPDGQSSQDSDSNEILFCEDETSNDIAYGVYCGVNPELNELGTELEEEDQFVKDNKSDDIVNG
ncbi:hypothetical protein HUJ04_011615 [Dendroctonus ponderosae]|nr:hypothetical protein HUJ04_011615 [Dendroctonus ponderosae]